MIRQLSVFVENKPGSLMDVTSRLTEAHVNIRAVATFDTPEFGILRLVVDKPDEAKNYLTERGFVVRIHEVMGVELEDKKGNLNQILHHFRTASETVFHFAANFLHFFLRASH